MSNVKHYIRDPVHDLIEFGDDSFEQMLWRVVQTSTFQRLRRIRQLGFCELVYPGATHNRFEHSLGVFNNARRLNNIAKQLLGDTQFDQERAEVSIAAALLHDVGHGPFSHSFEALGKRVNLRFGRHEALSDEIIRESKISKFMNEYRNGFANLVADMVAGKESKDIYSSVVSSLFDADRLDYLKRDQLMTGSQNSIIDQTWLFSNIEVEEIETINSNGEARKVWQFVFNSRAMLALQTYVLGLLNLYHSVYFHPIMRSAEYVFTQLICRIFEIVHEGHGNLVGLSSNHSIIRFAESPNELSKVLELDDFVFLGALSSMERAEDSEVSRLASMLRNRKLPKAIDIRDIVHSQIMECKTEYEIDAIVVSAIERITEYSQQNNLGKFVWIDSKQRPPYNTGKSGDGSQESILIRQAGKLVDLKDISGAVNVAQPFKVDRVYIADEKSEARSEISHLIFEACKSKG